MAGALYKRLRRIVGLLSILFMLQLGFLTRENQAQSFSDLRLDPERVVWTDLFFKAEHFLVICAIEVQLESFPAAAVEASLMAIPEGVPLQTSTQTVHRVTVNTTIDPLFGSTVTLRNQVWFDPKSGNALQRIRFRRGEDDFQKLYRFTKKGVYRLRREPAGKQEIPLPPEQWTDVRETFYPYDLIQIGCISVTESSVIPYIIASERRPQDSEPLDLCVFHKRLLHHVQIVPTGVKQHEVRYVERSKQAEVQKQGIVDALRLSLRARTLTTIEGEDEDFSFLGLKGDMAIYVDSGSGIPVQISGDIPTIGRVDLTLYDARLRE
jgi:hypothetical protein